MFAPSVVFPDAGGAAANSVAQWNGTSSSALSLGMNGGVVAAAMLGTNLIAGVSAANFSRRFYRAVLLAQ